MELWKRNGSRVVTGDDASWTATGLVLVLVLSAIIFGWEYLAQGDINFANRHSYPSNIKDKLYENANADMWRFLYTAMRGGTGVAIAFFFAYPIGALLPCIGFATKFAGVVICLLLAFPKLAVILITLRTVGHNELSVYVIGMWSGCLMMLALGFFHSLGFLTATDERGQMLDSAAMDGANPWQTYRHIIMPLIRSYHISSLYVVSSYVWTSTSFAEAIVSGYVQGLGERMDVKIQHDAGLGHFYAASLWLYALGAGTWVIVFLIQRFYGHKNKFLPIK